MSAVTATFTEGFIGGGGFGPGGYAAGGAHGADLTSGTTTTVTTTGKLEVPTNDTLENDGLIENSGVINSTKAMSRLTGTGTVHNAGSIVSGFTQRVDASQTVTGHNYAVTLSTVEGSTTLSSFPSYAPTLPDGGADGLPGPNGNTNYFVGWKATGGLLDGTWVDETTDLTSGGTNLATSASGALPVELHAHFAQTVSVTSTPPADAAVGGTYTPTATGGPSGNPVVFTVNQYRDRVHHQRSDGDLHVDRVLRARVPPGRRWILRSSVRDTPGVPGPRSGRCRHLHLDPAR